MKIIFDLELHSKYARAVSKEMVPEKMAEWAAIKGIQVIGTGDFTHPAWFKELKEKLIPAEPGLFRLKNPLSERAGKTRFLLSGEISCIYSKNGRVRRVHNLVYAPSFDIVDKINTKLSWIGNLKSDGRPIIGLDSKELLKIMMGASPEAYLIPAHCLLPESIIHTKTNLVKKIKDIQKGDAVFTHENRWQKVKQVLKRKYRGRVYDIKPYYFREGLTVTPEHPFYAIKTKKNCCWNKGICKPQHMNYERCGKKYFKNYKAEWITADKLEVGDVLIYPRFNNAFSNHKSLTIENIKTSNTLENKFGRLGFIGHHSNQIANFIPVDKSLCRLIGYYVAEGYTNGRDAVGFTFHKDEKQYIEEVIRLMQKVFNFTAKPKMRYLNNSVEIIFYSKILCELFSQTFYADSECHNASTKSLPYWTLGLTPDLLVEIFRCWWSGDKGYTVSRILMNQMKIILLRLGIVPSIYQDSPEAYQKRGKHFYQNREIKAQSALYSFSRLTFFEDKFDLLSQDEFQKFKAKSRIYHGWTDDKYVYMPIRNIEAKGYEGEVYNLEVENDNSYVAEFATIHNCWTPWFGVFGSKSGFDSLEECFDELTPYVFAIETGLSSDPPMNWRIPFLDNKSIVSGSDSHSLTRIGREATVLELASLSYKEIFDAIKSRDPRRFLFTIEFFPEEGRYHYDGHRDTKHSQTPEETKKAGGKCAQCGKPVTVGVMARIEELAAPDRPNGYSPSSYAPIPFRNCIPLNQIIADTLGMASVASKKVTAEYNNIIEKAGSEFKVLLETEENDIKSITTPEIAAAILHVREGKVRIEPGYDGEYGKIKILDKNAEPTNNSQQSLF